MLPNRVHLVVIFYCPLYQQQSSSSLINRSTWMLNTRQDSKCLHHCPLLQSGRQQSWSFQSVCDLADCAQGNCVIWCYFWTCTALSLKMQHYCESSMHHVFTILSLTLCMLRIVELQLRLLWHQSTLCVALEPERVFFFFRFVFN